ncbi:MAG: nitroreductase family deazaflavin-dependent oxidoreductase [Candidatus Nanopelagicales bacterium]
MSQPNRPPLPTSWRRILYRLPISLYRARLGGLMGSRFVLIHHVGRKSGLERQVVVEVVALDPTTRAVIVASGFGPTADWYQNVLAHPEVAIELGWERLQTHARRLTPEEVAETMTSYARRHPRSAKRLASFMGYEVQGEESYQRMGDTLPMLRLVPQ